ncbi:MAG: TonB-dependent receptor [Sandarakinorhabdus sp.]|jgi:iron complex outermembrane receptor protein|nr:TonB-dependent receptor [Sandarakinorhabdus sp.]
MKKRKFDRFSASVVALLAGSIMAPAAAQAQATAAADGAADSDIVVTARRTSERLQDVPLNVAVVSGAELRARGIDNLMELAKNTVGFAFEAITPIVVQPAIRGQTNLRTTSPVQNVPFNVDGIYLQRGYMIDQALLAVDRVEVIKGPQSALYGRNAFAGVINLQTRAPNLDEIEMEASGTVGNNDRFDARGLVSLPLIKGRLAVLAAVAHSQFDGVWRNEHPLANDPQAITRGNLGGWNKESYQLRVIAKPTDNLTFDAMYVRTERLIEQVPAYAAGTAGLATLVNTLNASPVGGQNRLLVGKLPADPVIGPGENRRPGLIVDPRAFGLRGPTDVVSAKLEYSPGEDWTAIYQFGFTRAAVNARGSPMRDPTVAIPPNFGGPNQVLFDSSGNESSFRGWSHELRIDYDNGGPLRVLIGANYSKTSDVESNGSELATLGSLVEPGPQFFFPLGPGLPFGTNVFQRNTNLVRDERIYSGFAFVGYKPMENLEITLEGRYTVEDQTNVDRLTREPTNTTLQALVPPVQSQTQRFFTPRGSITYRATPDNMIYASVGRGVKSGGFNGFVPFLPQRSYDPETNWTYELGSKNQFLDRRLTVNAALYHTRWRNVQTNGVRLTATGAAPPFNFIVPSLIENLGGVNVWGAELELIYKVNDWMTLDAGGNYNRVRYANGTVSQRFGASGNCDGIVCSYIPDPIIGRVLPIGGNQVERVPAFDAAFGASFNGKLNGDNSWFGRIGATYESKQFVDEANLAFVPARLIVNGNIGVDIGRFNFNLWAKNLLDKKYISSSLFLIGTGGAGSASYVPTLGDRRTVGLTATVRY